MRTGYLWAWVAGFVLANTSSSILFKLAAEASGRKALWPFILGNLVGALGPVTLTFGLKLGDPSLVYALCFGGAFTILQIVSLLVFNQTLSHYQWAGIGLVTLGIWLLQVGHK